MQRTFVLRLASVASGPEGPFRGHVEDVDSGEQLRFYSLEQLLNFLAPPQPASSKKAGTVEQQHPNNDDYDAAPNDRVVEE